MDNRKGQIIRIQRMKLGLTQEEIALTLGMATHHYQRYEYGESLLANSRMSTGLRICSLLQLDPYVMVFDLSAAEMADIDWSCGYENIDRRTR